MFVFSGALPDPPAIFPRMARSKAGSGGALSFERPIVKLLEEVSDLRKANEKGKQDLSEEIREKEAQADALTREIFGRLSAWERVQLSRHPERPHVGDYVDFMCTDVVELHGDRRFADDRAILTAMARLGDHRVLVVGHRKGKHGDVKDKVACNFGMANPEGYRKAILKMRLAERFGMPIIALVDTPGAYPGIGAEERGQAWAIAENIQDMTGLTVPIVVVVIGEGGSGGALGIGLGDRVFMFENSYYSVISPEGCAAILWKTRDKASEAAEQLCLTANDLLRLGIIDDIIAEPLGGAHRNREHTATNLKHTLTKALDELVGVPTDVLLEARYQKARKFGFHLF